MEAIEWTTLDNSRVPLRMNRTSVGKALATVLAPLCCMRLAALVIYPLWAAGQFLASTGEGQPF